MANMNKLEQDVASLHTLVKALADHFGIEAKSPSSERQQAEEKARKYWRQGGEGWAQLNGAAPAPAPEPAPAPTPEPTPEPVAPVEEAPAEDVEPEGETEAEDEVEGEAPRGRGRPRRN
jgi:hypothetical protein